MTSSLATVAYIGAAILFILSLGGLANPETARRGNLFGMIGMTLAVVATVLGPRVFAAGVPWIIGALVIGGAIGGLVSGPVGPIVGALVGALAFALVGAAAAALHAEAGVFALRHPRHAARQHVPAPVALGDRVVEVLQDADAVFLGRARLVAHRPLVAEPRAPRRVHQRLAPGVGAEGLGDDPGRDRRVDAATGEGRGVGVGDGALAVEPVEQLERLYPGQVRWVFRHRPLDLELTLAAEAAFEGYAGNVLWGDFLGVLALGMSMGQWLCLPMIAGGVGLWLWAQRQPVAPRKGACRRDPRADRRQVEDQPHEHDRYERQV